MITDIIKMSEFSLFTIVAAYNDDDDHLCLFTYKSKNNFTKTDFICIPLWFTNQLLFNTWCNKPLYHILSRSKHLRCYNNKKQFCIILKKFHHRWIWMKFNHFWRLSNTKCELGWILFPYKFLLYQTLMKLFIPYHKVCFTPLCN